MRSFTGNGKLINSDFLNGLSINEAKEKIIKKIEKNKIGNKKILFRLKDWEFLDKDTGVALFQ